MLGSFEVRTDDGVPVDVPGARLRGLLIALALEADRVVPKATLVDWIWGEHPPADAANALQRLVSRLRKALPEGLVEGQAGGYRLTVDPDAVDAVRFERLVAEARQVGGPGRVRLLREAMGLWRGAAMQDIGLGDSEAFDAAVTRLERLRLAAVEDRFEAEVCLGHGAGVVAQLTDAVTAHLLPDQFEEGDQFPGDPLGCQQRGMVAQPWQRFANVQVGDVVLGVLLRIGQNRTQPRKGLPAPQNQDWCSKLCEQLRVGGQWPVIGCALLDPLQRRRHDRCAPLEILPAQVLRLQRGELVVGGRVAVAGAGGLDEPAVGSGRAHLLQHGAQTGEVFLLHHRTHEKVVNGHGGHGGTVNGRPQHQRATGRETHQGDRLADAGNERVDILLQARGRVVWIVAGQPDTAEARQITGEPAGEVGEHRFEGDVAVVGRRMDQHQRRPVSLYPSPDLSAISRNGSVDPLSSHSGPRRRILVAAK